MIGGHFFGHKPLTPKNGNNTMKPPTDNPTSPITADSILEGPFWPEPVRVLSCKVRDQRIEIHAVGLQTEKYFSNLLDKEQPESSARELQMLAAVKLYELGKLSSGRAAQLAGITRVEFLLALGRYQVSPFALDAETLAEDIANA
jgi:predicted HTH domain antitoxin